MVGEQKVLSWFEEYQKAQVERQEFEKLEALKILDGESKIFKFLSNGKKLNTTYGETLLFEVEYAGKHMNYWVKLNQYTVLNVLVRLSPVIGKKVSVMRIGSKQSDTRYSVKEVIE
jgi:hypothetical protein